MVKDMDKNLLQLSLRRVGCSACLTLQRAWCLDRLLQSRGVGIVWLGGYSTLLQTGIGQFARLFAVARGTGVFGWRVQESVIRRNACRAL